jgi:hypothetical protein
MTQRRNPASGPACSRADRPARHRAVPIGRPVLLRQPPPTLDRVAVAEGPDHTAAPPDRAGPIGPPLPVPAPQPGAPPSPTINGSCLSRIPGAGASSRRRSRLTPAAIRTPGSDRPPGPAREHPRARAPDPCPTLGLQRRTAVRRPRGQCGYRPSGITADRPAPAGRRPGGPAARLPPRLARGCAPPPRTPSPRARWHGGQRMIYWPACDTAAPCIRPRAPK